MATRPFCFWERTGQAKPDAKSYLKKAFSTDIGVEASFQVLAIREYVCGLNLGLALISIENPNFEMLIVKTG